MSQTPFTHTHSALITNAFASTAETGGFGITPTASPVFDAWSIVGEIVPKIDDVEIDIRQIGSHQKYASGGMQTAAHKYSFTMMLNPTAIDKMGYGSNPPNYTTPAGTNAESLTFILGYKQALGGVSLTQHWVLFKGCKCNSLTITVTAEGLVEVTMEWICREITTPAASHGLTTPTIPDFSGITSAAISNVDSGAKPLTINAIAYAVNNWSITFNNNLIADPYIGTGLIEALNVGEIEVTGSFVTPVGQDLLLETAINAFPQTGVAAKFKYKAAAMFANIVGLKLISDDSPWRRGPTETKKHTYNWNCTSAALGTS